jgi:hypothetical protein
MVLAAISSMAQFLPTSPNERTELQMGWGKYANARYSRKDPIEHPDLKVVPLNEFGECP